MEFECLTVGELRETIATLTSGHIGLVNTTVLARLHDILDNESSDDNAYLSEAALSDLTTIRELLDEVLQKLELQIP